MKTWVKWLCLGLLSVLFGVFALANTALASVAVTIFTGVLFLLTGGIQIAAGLGETSGGRKLLSVVLGGLMALIGISFISNPLEGVLSLSLLVTILIAGGGIVRLILAWNMRQTQYFWAMLLSGALSVLLAGFILANFASVSVQLLGTLLGIELLFNGAGLMAMAFFIRTHPPHGK
ncbi:MAG: HdeD family acid-resistance protein [Qingshengfaniella sp.]